MSPAPLIYLILSVEQMSRRNQVYLVGAMKEEISGNKLPSKRDVLSVLFHNIRIRKLNLSASSKSVVGECMAMWNRASIPTKHKPDCVKKVKNLHSEWNKLQKSKNKKVTASKEKKLNDFMNSLDDLFDIAHENALKLIKNEEDRQFLLLQRKPGRPGYIAGIDRESAAVEKRKAEREEAEAKRRRIMTESQTFELGR